MKKSTKKQIIGFLIGGILACGVCCAGYASRNDDGKWFKNGNASTWHWHDKTDADGELPSASGDTTQAGNDNVSSNNPATPSEEEYRIEYLFRDDATNLSGLSVTGKTKAKAGETVTFKVTTGDSRYSVSGVTATVMNSNADVDIKTDGSSYWFTMPKGYVYVHIYIKYDLVQSGETLYSIEYDTLGWADASVVNIICPDKAAANARVAFTATIKPEYANEYRISNAQILLGSGERYIEELQPNNGVYTFIMPDSETMEDAINDRLITVLLYIIPIDM